MKGKYIIFLVLNFTIMFQCNCKTANAFEINVHEKITENAVIHSTDDFNGHLKDVGLNKGIDEIVKTKTIKVWLMEGSKEEDNGTRWRNHFYNPLNGVGLNDTDTLITGMPSFAWASYGPNEWSWKISRNKYYTGLTATTDNDRRAALAVSFQALGQVTHLVQDLASPAHVRNDAHPTGDGFEGYTKRADIVDTLNYTSYSFANALTSVTPHAPRQFWDSNTYTLQNPNPSTNNTQGLAEYTNANFFGGGWIC